MEKGDVLARQTERTEVAVKRPAVLFDRPPDRQANARVAVAVDEIGRDLLEQGDVVGDAQIAAVEDPLDAEFLKDLHRLTDQAADSILRVLTELFVCRENFVADLACGGA